MHTVIHGHCIISSWDRVIMQDVEDGQNEKEKWDFSLHRTKALMHFIAPICHCHISHQRKIAHCKMQRENWKRDLKLIHLLRPISESHQICMIKLNITQSSNSSKSKMENKRNHQRQLCRGSIRPPTDHVNPHEVGGRLDIVDNICLLQRGTIPSFSHGRCY